MKKFNVFLIVLMFFVGIFVYPYLPRFMPVHWNIKGEVNSYMNKNVAVLLIPAITAVIFFLFQLLPYFDPKKKNYKFFQKEWEIMQTGIIGFMAYIYFLTFYIALNPKASIIPGMFFGLGILFILVGKYLPKIRQNYFVGIKLPWTLASKDNWDKTHRFGGKCFVVSGIIILLEVFFLWNAPIIIFGSIFLSALLPIIYSYIIFSSNR